MLQVVVAIVTDISPFVRHSFVVICCNESSAVKFGRIAVYGLDFINTMSRFMFAKLTFATFPVLTQHISLCFLTLLPHYRKVHTVMWSIAAWQQTTFSIAFFACLTLFYMVADLVIYQD